MKRKGVIASLEAVIASSILLIFVLAIIPGITQEETDTLSPWREKLSGSLESLDESGKLREPAMELNLTKIQGLVDNYTSSTLKTTAGILYDNYTRGSISTSNQITVDFNVNKSRSFSEYLTLYISEAHSPNLTVNSQKVWENSSDMTEKTKKFSIGEYTQEGQNSFTLEVSSSSFIDYEINRYYYVQKDPLPSKGKVISTGHHISGKKKEFKPREVRILAWR